jgi:hypothetical protein
MPLAYPKVHVFKPTERGDSWTSRFMKFWQTFRWKRCGVLCGCAGKNGRLRAFFADLVWDARAISTPLPRPAWTALLIYLSEAESIMIVLAA